jgi:hypothetical protein
MLSNQDLIWLLTRARLTNAVAKKRELLSAVYFERPELLKLCSIAMLSNHALKLLGITMPTHIEEHDLEDTIQHLRQQVYLTFVE